MNKHLHTAAFIVGALGIAWVGIGFIPSSYLALLMTAIIFAVYLFGAFELQQFRRATAALANALAALPDGLDDLGAWLASVPPSLRNTVRLRIEGERIGLPGPGITPYLVGLLVMLGMLGTFLGMVVTLNGAVFALEKTTDLQAIRSALAVPIKGLGLAFGTSVAGVAGSAMLGLMSALSRRERMATAQTLDTKIGTVLRRFSLAHQRQETFRALQLQSQALPQVVDRLQAMMAQMEGMSQQLNGRLISNQEGFYSEVKTVYTDLARAVDESLRSSLRDSAQAAGASLKPVLEAAMSGIAHDAQRMHERMAGTAQKQLDELSARFSDTTAIVASTWSAALDSHQQASTRVVDGVDRALTSFSATFAERSAALVDTVGATAASQQAEQAKREQERQQAWSASLDAMAATLARELQQSGARTLSQQQAICDTLTHTVQDITERSQAGADHARSETTRLISSAEDLLRARITGEAQSIAQQGERMDRLTDTLRSELSALRNDEAARGNAAVERLAQLQTALTAHLTTLGTALEAPITRLIETASEAPRAAAEVIGKLREEVSSSVARDNALLEERSRIMATLDTLLSAINHSSTEQRAVIDQLVASSATKLDAASSAFAENVAGEAAKLSDMGAHVAGSAVEVASLSDAFGFAVQSFSEANERLIANLQRIEGALDKSMARSDDQLAYYVAQAREIIDLSMMSQREILEGLRRIPAHTEAAG